MLAQVCLLRREFDLALQYVQRAVELNPTNQWNAADQGIILIRVGEAENALACFRRAREIDPYFDPPWYFRAIGQAHMVLHRYMEALAKFDQLTIRTHRADAYVAACHAQLGNAGQASASVSECLAKQPEFSIQRFMMQEPF